MGIFISYQSDDSSKANDVYNYLSRQGIDCYLDKFDGALSGGSSKNITEILVDRIKKHDTLFAIVSEKTQSSWWVPFEIGTARQMPRVITSYTTISEFSLPDYLKEWPRLRTSNDLAIFARTYSSNKRIIKEASEAYGSSISRAFDSARSFERNVMSSLGQR